jgi:hypothetical protein
MAVNIERRGTMTSSASATYGERFEESGARHHGRCGGVKSRWSILEIGAMVAGFVIFWPLGLLALFLKFKNGEMWRGAADAKAPWEGFRKPDFAAWRDRGYGFAETGNAAFDAYKRDTLKRLDEERRKLDEEQKSFRDFVERVRRAKDQEEFDRFMAERRAGDVPPAGNA